MCYQAKGDLDTAIELTKRYIAEEPEDILAFTNLSMFYQKKGMIKEADTAIRSAHQTLFCNMLWSPPNCGERP